MAAKKVAARKETVVRVRPIRQERILVTIEGTSPLMQHNWSEKQRKAIRDKKAGIKTKTREKCDPQAEFEAATYRTADGGYGVPVDALKAAAVGAAHKDLGIDKTLVRKSLFIKCDDPGGVLPMTCSEPVMDERSVRVGVGSADLRYRPLFEKWEVPMVIEFDAENLTPEDVVNLINRAGFGVGIGEMRPEKGKNLGRFQVKTMEAAE